MDYIQSSKTSPSQSQDPENKENIQSSMKAREKESVKRNYGRRFLGVRQRPSGRWVAEIKVSSQKLRLWLGTFDKAEEAALAYDRAARLLRGRNAKTNFPITLHEETCCNINPRLYHLLQHAIMKNVNRSRLPTALIDSSSSTSGNIEFTDSVVEDTIFCTSTTSTISSENNKGCGFSFGGSKVYTSVFVAPSFSSDISQLELDEDNTLLGK